MLYIMLVSCDIDQVKIDVWDLYDPVVELHGEDHEFNPHCLLDPMDESSP